MEWFVNMRSRVGQIVLNREFKKLKRIPTVCSLTEAKKVGIIYNATELISFDIIKDFAQNIKDFDVMVHILGYVNSEDLIDHYLYRKGFNFFCKAQLNWYYMPVSEVTDKFIKEPFDILIDLSLENYYPIQYITALSPAKFKAGRYTQDDPYLDLMIDIEKEKQLMKKIQSEVSSSSNIKANHRGFDSEMKKKTETELQLNFLTNQLMHYLTILKKNSL